MRSSSRTDGLYDKHGTVFKSCYDWLDRINENTDYPAMQPMIHEGGHPAIRASTAFSIDYYRLSGRYGVTRPYVSMGQSSVRKGEAGSPALL